MPLHPAARISLRSSGSTRWTRVLQYHRMSSFSRRIPAHSSRTRFLFIVNVSSKNETVRTPKLSRRYFSSSRTLSAERNFHVVFATVQKEHANGHPLLAYMIVNGLHAGAETKYGSREGSRSYAGTGMLS